MISQRKAPDHYFSRADHTLWVNGPANLLGRFSPLGYEVYRKLDEAPEDFDAMSGNVLSVKVQTMTVKDWNNFVTLMMDHHGIDLADESCPL